MKAPSKQQIERYLETFPRSGGKSLKAKKKRIHIDYFGPLNRYDESQEKDDEKNPDLKKMGYGSPYLIVYQERESDGKKRERRAILSTMRIGHGFGHDYRADRIDNVVLSFDTWNSMPHHVRVWDIGAFNRNDSSLLSLGSSGEFFLLRPMVQGVEYYKDLDRIFRNDKLENGDLEKAVSLAKYLSKIHAVKYSGDGRRELYARKIRDTVGHGECIFGLADSYPSSATGYLSEGELSEIEKKCITQRWKLKDREQRLSQVHGDFHPWNILFEKERNRNSRFVLLDRSRGKWGEPADDVCALSINYLFYALRKYGRIEGDFRRLFDKFMETYQEDTNDSGLSVAMPLFYVFRALVVASPVWYPDLTNEVRRKIFNFAQNILNDGDFDYNRIENYFEAVY